MPYTPDEQRILDHVANRITQIKNGYQYRSDVPVLRELQTIMDLMEDIKATRDKEYPCDKKGE